MIKFPVLSATSSVLAMTIVVMVGGAVYRSQQVEIEAKSLAQIAQQQEIARVSDFMQLRNSRLAPEIAGVIATNLVKISEEKHLPVALVLGIVEKETLYNPFEISKAGARGLMQILKGDEVEIDPDKAHGIVYNLNAGTEILREKIEQCNGDLNEALQAYSGGAKGYKEAVLANMGRFMLYEHREVRSDKAQGEGAAAKVLAELKQP